MNKESTCSFLCNLHVIKFYSCACVAVVKLYLDDYFQWNVEKNNIMF